MLDFPDADAYDRAVAASAGIDRWCSSTDWVLPLTSSMRPHEPFILRSSSGWGVFDRLTEPDGRRILLGVDRIWGFACPVIGDGDTWSDVAAMAVDESYHVVVLPGLVEEGPTWHDAIAAFDPTHVLHRAGGITRCNADLADGFDAWFARRSARFRQRVRRLDRDATDAGLVIEPATGADESDLIDRLTTIEAHTWKGAEGDGLMSGDMADFYRLVLRRLGPSRTRCLIARLGGRDVGYIVGGVRGSTYRGLQLSATQAVETLGVGHLLQLRQIELLADETVSTYDLGMDMAYKHRWSDAYPATTTVAAFLRDRA